MSIDVAPDQQLVDSASIATFQRVGAVALRGLVNLDWLRELKGAFDEMIRGATDLSGYYENTAPGKVGALQTVVREEVWIANETIRRFTFDSPIGRAAAHLMRSSTSWLYEDLLIFKERATNQPTPWHQDAAQWPMEGRQICSSWLSIDRVTRETGALRFVAGSHNGPLYRPYVPAERQADLQRDAHLFEGELPDVDAEPQRFEIVSYDTEPGDVVFFHPRTVHAAFGSASTHPRRTLSTRFMGDDMRWKRKHTVFFPWIAAVDLQDGDLIRGPRFPRVWPPAPQEERLFHAKGEPA